ncbi:hypothetical protein B0T19DRAFT_212321 [Cercophora scortea]|uniref:Uncharacterized protein n=1 Tax=Cercophora scortea TaxID=314031 RepID=A0AAE0IEH2_9PEZI|nr:hypothetical protein B0T19DRAFT_212321 [Cercophora scortea]
MADIATGYRQIMCHVFTPSPPSLPKHAFKKPICPIQPAAPSDRQQQASQGRSEVKSSSVQLSEEPASRWAPTQTGSGPFTASYVVRQVRSGSGSMYVCKVACTFPSLSPSPASSVPGKYLALLAFAINFHHQKFHHRITLVLFSFFPFLIFFLHPPLPAAGFAL